MTLRRVPLGSRGVSVLDQAASSVRAVFSLNELNEPARRPARSLTPTAGLASESKKRPRTERASVPQRAARMDSASSRIRASFVGSHDETLRHLAAQEATPVSLDELYKVAANESESSRLENAQFLYHELPIRMAHRVHDLRRLPYGLSDKQPIQQVAELYSDYVRKMLNFGEPQPGPVDDRRFTQLLESFFLEQGRVIERMAQGVIELSAEIQQHPTLAWDHQIEADVTAMLDRFFTARIGLRLLVEQHFSAPLSRPGFAGVIESSCSPEQVAKQAIQDASYLCTSNLGLAPEVALYGDSCYPEGFTYLPSHMHYVLLELLKNAMRSTVETHRHKSGELPMVQIMIAHGDEDVTFKICDEGGGIPRSEIDAVWTYLHSSATRPPIAEDLKQENRHKATVGVLAGYGMGLPLSRIYAEYFGGNLDIKSMEGFGTDCYLHLCRLGVNCEKLPAEVVHSPASTASTLESYCKLVESKEEIRSSV